MASFNRVILAGNLTRDPQLSYLPSGTAACELGLAMNRKFRDKDGNQREEVCFVDLQAFARTAEVINQYFRKGNAILIEGRLRYREWTNKEGQKRNKLEVVVDTFSFIESGGGGGGGQRGDGGYRGGGGGGQRGGATQGQSQSYDGPSGSDVGDDMPPPSDPDVPF